MYFSHHQAQNSTDQKVLPAGLLLRLRWEFCRRSDSRWYSRKCSCSALPPAACIREYSDTPESLCPIFSGEYQKAWFWKHWCNQSHALFPLSASRSARCPQFQKAVLHFGHVLLLPPHDPGSISAWFRKNKRPESVRSSFAPALTYHLFPSSQSYRLFCGTATQLPDRQALLSFCPIQWLSHAGW